MTMMGRKPWFWFHQWSGFRPSLAGDDWGRHCLVVPLVPGFFAVSIAGPTCHCEECKRMRNFYHPYGI